MVMLTSVAIVFSCLSSIVEVMFEAPNPHIRIVLPGPFICVLRCRSHVDASHTHTSKQAV